MRQPIIILTFLFILMLWIGYSTPNQTIVQPETNTQSSISKQQPINPTLPETKIFGHAISPITKGNYPKLYKKWGAKNVTKINKLLKPAALYAAKSNSCDKVDVVDLADSRSTPPNNIVLYVDCLNGQRFYVSERDIKSDTVALSKQEKTQNITDIQATMACEEAVKEDLQFPDSFDKKSFSTQVLRAQTGNIAIIFDFDAKNGIGNILPQKVRCVIDEKGINPPEISNR